MKNEVIKILKEKHESNLFTEDRFKLVKELMKIAMQKDAWLKNYLSLDPLNKADWCADILIKLAHSGK